MFKKQSLELDKAIAGELKLARDVLLDSPKILRMKVKRLAARGDRDGHALALYTLAAGHRFNWSPEDWAAVLNKLDDCEMKVGDWIDALESANP